MSLLTSLLCTLSSPLSLLTCCRKRRGPHVVEFNHKLLSRKRLKNTLSHREGQDEEKQTVSVDVECIVEKEMKLKEIRDEIINLLIPSPSSLLSCSPSHCSGSCHLFFQPLRPLMEKGIYSLPYSSSLCSAASSSTSTFPLLSPYLLIHVNLSTMNLLPLPLSLDSIKYLVEISSPTPFGRGEVTVWDEKVRKGKELHYKPVLSEYEQDARREVANARCFELLQGETEWIQNNKATFAWERNGEYCSPFLSSSSLSSLLEEVRLALCPHYERVIARGYKLVCYSEGDHFTEHRDSVRGQNHIATLIIILPTEGEESQYEGGVFRIQDPSTKEKTHIEWVHSPDGNSTSTMKYVAFYTDCVHSVDQITKGYRITVQYNLYGDAPSPSTSLSLAPSLPPINVQSLSSDSVSVLSTLFSLDSLFPYQYAIYSLVHQYSPLTLTPEQMKGVDRHVYSNLSALFPPSHIFLSCCDLDMSIEAGYEVEDPDAPPELFVRAMKHYGEEAVLHPLFFPLPEYSEQEVDKLLQEKGIIKCGVHTLRLQKVYKYMECQQCKRQKREEREQSQWGGGEYTYRECAKSIYHGEYRYFCGENHLKESLNLHNNSERWKEIKAEQEELEKQEKIILLEIAEVRERERREEERKFKKGKGTDERAHVEEDVGDYSLWDDVGEFECNPACDVNLCTDCALRKRERGQRPPLPPFPTLRILNEDERKEKIRLFPKGLRVGVGKNECGDVVLSSLSDYMIPQSREQDQNVEVPVSAFVLRSSAFDEMELISHNPAHYTGNEGSPFQMQYRHSFIIIKLSK